MTVTSTPGINFLAIIAAGPPAPLQPTMTSFSPSLISHPPSFRRCCDYPRLYGHVYLRLKLITYTQNDRLSNEISSDQQRSLDHLQHDEKIVSDTSSLERNMNNFE